MNMPDFARYWGNPGRPPAFEVFHYLPLSGQLWKTPYFRFKEESISHE